MPARLRRVVLALAVLLVVAGCQEIEQLPRELAGAPLVTLELSGGRCVDGRWRPLVTATSVST